MFVNDDDNDVDVGYDRTREIVDDVDLTRAGDFKITDNIGQARPCSLFTNTGSLLDRKRKGSPVCEQNSLVKKVKNTPLADRNDVGSERIKIKQKSNLITNHFYPFSLVTRRSEGQAVHAVQGGAGVRGGGDGGKTGAVQGACARNNSGRLRGGKGGKSKRVVSASTIGPDQTAATIQPNQGKNKIQLIVEKLQRGNTSASNR